MTVSAKNAIDFVARGKTPRESEIPHFQAKSIPILPPSLAEVAEGEPFPKALLLELSAWLDKLEAPEQRSVFTQDEFATILVVLKHSGEPILKQKALRLCYQALKTVEEPYYAEDLRHYTRALLATPQANLWEISGSLLLAARLESAALLQKQCAEVIEASVIDRDGFFLRAQILEHAKSEPSLLHALQESGHNLLWDASPYVRIRALELLQLRSAPEDFVERIRRGDGHPNVQATLLALLSQYLFQTPTLASMLKSAFLGARVQWENGALGTFLQRFNEDAQQALESLPVVNDAWRDDMRDILQSIGKREDDGLRRLLAVSHIYLDLLSNLKLRSKFILQRSILRKNARPDVLIIPRSELNEELPYLLSALAYQADGFEIETSRHAWTLRPAYHFGFSAWRFFYELLHLSTSKRQGAAHWISRKLRGSIRIPSSIGCELVKTSVPGEPLYISEAGGWRPFLPLLCDLYHMLFREEHIRIYTPDGCTDIHRPRSLKERIRAWCHINLHYDELSDLRNWTHRSASNPLDYVKRMRKLGYRVKFTARLHTQERDRTIDRFFEEAREDHHVRL